MEKSKEDIQKIRKHEKELAKIEAERDKLTRKMYRKKRFIRKLRYQDKAHRDFLEVTMQFLLDGIVQEQKVSYSRGMRTSAFTMDDILRHGMMIEFMRGSGTYLDYLIEDHRKFFNIDEAEEKRLMDKYWHKRKNTIADMMGDWTKSDEEMFESKDNFILYYLNDSLSWFSNLAGELQNSLLYALWKYEFGSDFSAFEQKINELPSQFKGLVDTLFKKDDDEK